MVKHLASEVRPSPTYIEEVTIVLPSADQEPRLLVRRKDLERIKRLLGRLKVYNETWSKLAIALFTLSVSTLLTAFTVVAHTQGLPGWAPTVWWCVGVTAGVGAILCAIFQRYMESARDHDTKETLTEIESLLQYVDGVLEQERSRTVEAEWQDSMTTHTPSISEPYAHTAKGTE